MEPPQSRLKDTLEDLGNFTKKAQHMRCASHGAECITRIIPLLPPPLPVSADSTAPMRMQRGLEPHGWEMTAGGRARP